MKLSTKIWEKALPIVHAIERHPFNQELMTGKLDIQRFGFFYNLDIRYLRLYSCCVARLAAKAPPKYMRTLLKFADTTLEYEQEMLHSYQNKYDIKEDQTLTPSFVSYTNHQLVTCLLDPFEVGIAVILPCLWIYLYLGAKMANKKVPHNIYQPWIDEYYSIEFIESVHTIIEIFDELGDLTSTDNQNKMSDVFLMSCRLEWHFIDDAYYKKILGPPNLHLASCFNNIGNLGHFSQQFRKGV